MSRKTISNSLTKQNCIVTKDDLNGYGLMHGGRLLTLCDEIGYLAAIKHAEQDCLTRAAHNIQFLSAMREGEPFTLQAKVILTGKTTMWVACSVKREQQTIMSAVFVFIAIDKDFKSVPVATIEAESREEKSEQAIMQQLYNRVTKN